VKILLVTHYFSSHGGGIEIVAHRLASALRARGHEIKWAALDLRKLNEALPQDIEALPMRGTNLIEQKLRLPYPLVSPGGLKKIREAMAWADIVHIHDGLYFANQFAARIALKKQKPILLTQHIGHVPYRSAALQLAMKTANRFLTQTFLRKASRVVFISEIVRAFFSNAVDQNKVRTIYNGVDLETFHPGKESQTQVRQRLSLEMHLDLCTEKPVYLFAGRFIEKKRIESLRPLTEATPDAQWIFIGRGPLNPRRWNLPNVKVIGHISQTQLADWYRAADLLLLPSVGEGFPLVVQEAMACGLPCLVSEEIREACPPAAQLMLSAGVKGDSLESAFADATRNFEALRERRNANSGLASQMWSWQTCAKQYEELFVAS